MDGEDASAMEGEASETSKNATVYTKFVHTTFINSNNKFALMGSVTRFGEISPLGSFLKSGDFVVGFLII